jgi:uncharacterized membrane protein
MTEYYKKRSRRKAGYLKDGVKRAIMIAAFMFIVALVGLIIMLCNLRPEHLRVQMYIDGKLVNDNIFASD